jgi:hypothetical protein
MTEPSNRPRHDQDQPVSTLSPPGIEADDDPDEPAGDVATALAVVNALSGTQPLPPDAFQDLLARADHRELLGGLATLIAGFAALFPQPWDIVSPVVRRLQNLQLVPDAQLPTAAALLTAAAVGQSPSRWRRHHGGRVTGFETQTWAYTAWLLADLLDFTYGPGTVSKLTDQLVCPTMHPDSA